MYIMDHPDLNVCSFIENYIGLKRVDSNRDFLTYAMYHHRVTKQGLEKTVTIAYI